MPPYVIIKTLCHNKKLLMKSNNNIQLKKIIEIND